MISTNENAEFYARRAKFDKAIKDECKEIGSINCLSRVIHIITELACDDASNIYNHKELNDEHLARMLELHDACKEERNEH